MILSFTLALPIAASVSAMDTGREPDGGIEGKYYILCISAAGVASIDFSEHQRHIECEKLLRRSMRQRAEFVRNQIIEQRKRREIIEVTAQIIVDIERRMEEIDIRNRNSRQVVEGKPLVERGVGAQ